MDPFWVIAICLVIIAVCNVANVRKTDLYQKIVEKVLATSDDARFKKILWSVANDDLYSMFLYISEKTLENGIKSNQYEHTMKLEIEEGLSWKHKDITVLFFKMWAQLTEKPVSAILGSEDLLLKLVDQEIKSDVLKEAFEESEVESDGI